MAGPALRTTHEPMNEPGIVADEAPGWLAAEWRESRGEDRHSRRVALLKRVLPALGGALLLLIAAWPRLAPLWDRMRLAWPAIDPRDARELQMVHPRYAGLDRLGRPVVVTAAAGHQIPDRPDLMSLTDAQADLKTHAGADLVVTADTGVYQSQSQLLDLFGDVTLVHQNGTRFVTQRAHVDAAGNTAEGSDPVVGHGPSGDVKAAGFRLLDRGDTIVFTGRSEMVLRGARPAVAKSAPPALPAPVAALAVRTEAEAKPLLRPARPAAAAPHVPANRRPAAPAAKTATHAKTPPHGTP